MATAARTILSVFATFAVGGQQVRFAALANRYGPRYRHLIVAMDGNDACRERLLPSLDVSFPSVPIRKGATLANLRAFRRFLREHRPDVLVTHSWGSIEWAMANLTLMIRPGMIRPTPVLPAVVRHVHVEDGFGPEERDRQIRRRVLTRRVVLRRSLVALPSRTLVRIAAGTWRLDPRRVHYIPNGIDLGRFPGAPDPASAAAWPGEGPVVATVAALRAEKNLGRLLRAFAAATQGRAAGLIPARLVIIGDGPERAGLEALAASLGIAPCVSFLGHVADPAPLYAGFDLFALSSDTEQMPIAVIEAMAAGLSIAATEVGDVRSMLAGENAPWIGPRDDTALAASLAALLGDAALRARVGVANRARALATFDQERMFAAYAALFDGERLP
jgi:glycosyltransferase involved in cell wall biosynthesis